MYHKTESKSWSYCDMSPGSSAQSTENGQILQVRVENFLMHVCAYNGYKVEQSMYPKTECES